MAEQLIIVGAGGFSRETAAAVAAINAVQHTWDLLGYVDDSPALLGAVVDGVPVLGPIAAVSEYSARVVVCTGNPANFHSRALIVERLALPPDQYATVVHPAGSLAPGAEIGAGSVLLAYVVITAAARVGCHVAVMPQVVVTHDDVIGDYATLAAGVRLAGGVRVGDGAYVGAGALVREHRSIGAGALVGMGSVVTRDVPPGATWAGVPARALTTADRSH